jgi:hydrogenase maturation protease
MKTQRILVAGIGNIHLGDDAFGVEVVRQLPTHDLPENVSVVDFGLRCYDLAYTIVGESDVVILVDAVTRGELPGTLCLVEPNVRDLADRDSTVSGQTLSPATVLQMAQSMNPEALKPGRVFIVGCEPAVIDGKYGCVELSEPVSAAVPRAMRMIRSLIQGFLPQGALRAAPLAAACT